MTMSCSMSSSGCYVHALSMRCCRVGFCGWPSPPKLECASGPDAGASPAEAVKWPSESAPSYGVQFTHTGSPRTRGVSQPRNNAGYRQRHRQRCIPAMSNLEAGTTGMGPLTEPPAERVRLLLCVRLLTCHSGRDEIAPLCWISKAVARRTWEEVSPIADHRLAC